MRNTVMKWKKGATDPIEIALRAQRHSSASDTVSRRLQHLATL
jgi:hypothetical protein